MKTENNTYPGFNYAAEALSASTQGIYIFSITLNEGIIILHVPQDIIAFEHRLSIRNIKNQLL